MPLKGSVGPSLTNTTSQTSQDCQKRICLMSCSAADLVAGQRSCTASRAQINFLAIHIGSFKYYISCCILWKLINIYSRLLFICTVFYIVSDCPKCTFYKFLEASLGLEFPFAFRDLIHLGKLRCTSDKLHDIHPLLKSTNRGTHI